MEVVWALVGIFLGAFLSTFSQRYIEKLQKQDRLKTFKAGVRVELCRLKYHLTINAYNLYVHTFRIDHQFLLWFFDNWKNNDGPNDLSIPEVEIQKLLTMSDSEINAELTGKRNPSIAKSLKHLIMPFLDSQMSTAGLLPPNQLVMLLDILSQVSMLNENIDEVTIALHRTFDENITDHNRKVNDYNLNKSYIIISEQCIYIGDKINNLLEQKF